MLSLCWCRVYSCRISLLTLSNVGGFVLLYTSARILPNKVNFIWYFYQIDFIFLLNLSKYYHVQFGFDTFLLVSYELLLFLVCLVIVRVLMILWRHFTINTPCSVPLLITVDHYAILWVQWCDTTTTITSGLWTAYNIIPSSQLLIWFSMFHMLIWLKYQIRIWLTTLYLVILYYYLVNITCILVFLFWFGTFKIW